MDKRKKGTNIEQAGKAEPVLPYSTVVDGQAKFGKQNQWPCPICKNFDSP